MVLDVSRLEVVSMLLRDLQHAILHRKRPFSTDETVRFENPETPNKPTTSMRWPVVGFAMQKDRSALERLALLGP